jgi:hypothetical protein
MRSIGSNFTSAALAAALVFASTAAAAAPARGQNAWTTLSTMNPAGAAALGGAVAAAQDPVVTDDPHNGFYLPIPVLAVILAVIALDIWIITKDHDHHLHNVSPD